MKTIYVPYDGFKMIMDKCIELLSIKINIFGYDFEIIEIVFCCLVLYLVVWFVHFAFTHQ